MHYPIRFYIWPRYALEVNGKRIVFPNKPGAALARLFVARGNYVSLKEIIEAVYFDDPEGGPLCADNCIGVFMHKMRKLLSHVGVDIEGWRGEGGFRLAIGDKPVIPEYAIPPPNPKAYRGSYRYVSDEDWWCLNHRKTKDVYRGYKLVNRR